jgi:hypothetical protein
LTSLAPIPSNGAKVLSPAPEPSAGTRKSALLLHALAHADREWIMAQLPEAERATLVALLAELESLGIPADRALVDEVVNAVREPEESATHSREAALVREIAFADSSRLSALLRDEPALVLVHLLRIADWPWRAELRKHLGEAKWLEAEAGLKTLRKAPALRAQVLESVARHLRADSKPAPRGQVSSFLARLRGKRSRP